MVLRRTLHQKMMSVYAGGTNESSMRVTNVRQASGSGM